MKNMNVLKPTLTTISSVLIAYGIFLISWPAPFLFLVPEDFKFIIFNWIYNLDNDKSKMPELLFLWFFWHVPCGIFYFLIGCLVKFTKDNL